MMDAACGTGLRAAKICRGPLLLWPREKRYLVGQACVERTVCDGPALGLQLQTARGASVQGSEFITSSMQNSVQDGRRRWGDRRSLR